MDWKISNKSVPAPLRVGVSTINNQAHVYREPAENVIFTLHTPYFTYGSPYALACELYFIYALKLHN